MRLSVFQKVRKSPKLFENFPNFIIFLSLHLLNLVSSDVDISYSLKIMTNLKHDLLVKSRIEERLKRIANVLLLNASFIDNPGLLNGKMGIAIFFYQYFRYTGNKIFGDYAGELIDEIYEEINTNTPVDFANGLTGIGWGVEYLVKNKFVEADTDETLSEIDTSVYRNSLYRPFLLENEKDLFGYGLYYITRLREHENDDDNLNTLFKKQHLIYLIDDCERILIQKSFLKFNLQSLSIDTINSFLWFLLEMYRLKLFPMKAEKLFRSLPEYLESCLQSSDDSPGQSQLIQLTENIINCVADKDLRLTIQTILKKKNGKVSDANTSEDILVNIFIKNTWQQLVYTPYVIEDNIFQNSAGNLFSIIDNEDNWNRRLDNLNKNNLGLKGLTGLGLGLLALRMKEELRTTESEIRAENIKEQIEN